jgi:hypothetical protein
MITWADVTGLDPSLSSVPVGAQALFLGLANRLSPCLGDVLTTARILYAAHFGVLHRRAAALSATAAGPVTAEREGELSASYGNGFAAGGGIASASGLSSTTWGMMYLELIRNSTTRGPLLT